MASLVRSTKSFRRQGSSGSVWSKGEDSAEKIHPSIEVEGRLAGLRNYHSFGGGTRVATGEVNVSGPPVWRRVLSAPPAGPPLPKQAKKSGFAKICGIFSKFGKRD